jgi:ribosomal protein S18 acetylase RimI-like enzyme
MVDNWPTTRGSGDEGALKELVIRELYQDDSLEELTELLHRSYEALAEMGLKYVATYQDVATTGKRISQGVTFVAVLGGKLVGTIIFTRPEHTNIPRGKPIPLAGKLNQLGVEPKLQGMGIGKRLFVHAEEYAKAKGVSALVLDTAEPATHLIKWYERMGYQFVEYVQWDITNYRSVVMVKYFR